MSVNSMILHVSHCFHLLLIVWDSAQLPSLWGLVQKSHCAPLELPWVASSCLGSWVNKSVSLSICRLFWLWVLEDKTVLYLCFYSWRLEQWLTPNGYSINVHWMNECDHTFIVCSFSLSSDTSSQKSCDGILREHWISGQETQVLVPCLLLTSLIWPGIVS